MRLIGAGLVCASALWCGLLAAADLRRRAARCAELCALLELMAFELERFRTPLPDLFTSLADRTEGAASALCGCVAEGLARGGSFCAAWTEAVALLDPAERAILSSLGPVLGRYGAPEQTAALGGTLARLRALRDERQRERREKSRVRVGVCAAAGLALAVLLL